MKSYTKYTKRDSAVPFFIQLSLSTLMTFMLFSLIFATDRQDLWAVQHPDAAPVGGSKKTPSKLSPPKTPPTKFAKAKPKQYVVFRAGHPNVEIIANGNLLGVTDSTTELKVQMEGRIFQITAKQNGKELMAQKTIAVTSKQNRFDFSYEIAEGLSKKVSGFKFLLPPLPPTAPPEPKRMEENFSVEALLQSYKTDADKISASEWHKALEQIRKETAEDSDFNPLEIFIRSQIAFTENKTYEANKLIGIAIRLKPDEALVHYGYALLLLKTGNSPGAARELLTVVNLKNDFASAYKHLGDIYQSNGSFSEALTNYKLAEQYGTNTEQLRLAIIGSQIKTGNCYIAAKESEFLREVGTFDILIATADCFIKQNQKLAALLALNRAVELNPGAAVAHYKMGQIFSERKEYASARDAFLKAHQTDTGNQIDRALLEKLISEATSKAAKQK